MCKFGIEEGYFQLTFCIYSCFFFTLPKFCQHSSFPKFFVIPTLIARFMGSTLGPIWGRQDPGGPHVDPMNIDICEVLCADIFHWCSLDFFQIDNICFSHRILKFISSCLPNFSSNGHHNIKWASLYVKRKCLRCGWITHWGGRMHMCISRLVHHWFR